MKNDSIQFARQKKLLAENAGTQIEYEGSELSYQASSTNYQSAITQYEEYRRQLDFNSSQAQKNARISGIMAKDYTVYSEIDGKVYSITKLKGEMISVQTELAIIGDASKFVLEMQVDESDILRIKLGQKVIISLDSYGDSTFTAKITKINPIMDIRSKTFLLEAEFVKQPSVLYPNMNFEANIIIESKDKAIIIPRNYLIDEHIVLNAKGDSIEVVTGLKNYQQVEIVAGLAVGDKIKQPVE
jgi:multidrug efflux pump subunit AcrA (membrane-fusion protein)